MAYRRKSREFKSICEVAAFRVGIVWRTVDALVPDFTPQKKKRLCNRILTLLDGRDRSIRITQGQAQDLILPHIQCIAKDCPACMFWEPISRSLNLFFHEEEE
jgi:hypothetical protein